MIAFRCIRGPARRWRRALIVLLTVFLVVIVVVIYSQPNRGWYLEWTPRVLPAQSLEAQHFVLGRDQEIYMYSAFVKIHGRNQDSSTQIVVTSLDKSRASLVCCLLFSDRKTLYVTSSSTYFDNGYPNVVKEYTSPTVYIARQLSCVVPVSSVNLTNSYITLTSDSCSSDLRDYLPILQPSLVPGGLALCAKIAHSGGLDPAKLIEWFEVQRIMDVDKILMFDLGNPESLNRVFKYYQSVGVLDLQPYELPGLPKNRSLLEKWKRTVQFNQDETMAAMECPMRMAGYDFVLSHDADEMVVPRRNETVKQFLRRHLSAQPSAAGFHFHTQFFITDWTPTNPEETIMVKRYRLSTPPRWECFKYAFLPSRTNSITTHDYSPSRQEYFKVKIGPEEATLHHYRKCPRDTWGTCTVTTHLDDVMTRYHELDQRVADVKRKTQTL